MRTRQEIEEELDLAAQQKHAEVTCSVNSMLTVELLLDIRDLLDKNAKAE